MTWKGPPGVLGVSPSVLLCCTAFEFGDPFLTPAPIWPGAPSGPSFSEDPSFHPPQSSVSPRRRSLVTATIYPLHQQSQQGGVPGSRFSFGTPFPSATVRITRQGVTIYRQSDRVFLVDIRWGDVNELKRHTPADEPSLTEIAIVFSRGIAVLDVSSAHVASGVWATLQHFHMLTDDIVVEELRRAAWSQTLTGGIDSEPTAGRAPSDGHPPHEPELVDRAKEILQRFLGPNHNLVVTSPTRPAAQRELLSPSDSPHKGGSSRQPSDRPRRSASQLSARDRADELRREQDEQLQRLRRRESEMRSEIQHISSSSRGTTPRSISAASTVMGGPLARSDSPDVSAVNERRRRAAAAARSSTPSVVVPQRRAPLPPAPTTATLRSSAPTTTTPERDHAHSVRGASHTSEHPQAQSSRLDELEYHAMRSIQVARMQEREELTSDIAHLMESLEESGRSSAAGASAQARRLSDSFGIGEEKRDDRRSHQPVVVSSAAQVAAPVKPLSAESSMYPQESPAGPVSPSHVVAQEQRGESTPSPAPSSASQWVTKRTADGRVYYVNAAAQRTTWKIEETDLPQPTAAGAPQPIVKSEATKGAPPNVTQTPGAEKRQPAPGWKTVVSDKGVPYYFHPPSRATTWKVDETYKMMAAAGVEVAESPGPSVGPATAVTAPSVAQTKPSVAPKAPSAPMSTTSAALSLPSSSGPSAITAQDGAEDAGTNSQKKRGDDESAARPAVTAKIQTDEDIKRENDARKQQASSKAEEDKQTIRFGNMSLAEALRREQQALSAAANPSNGTADGPKINDSTSTNVDAAPSAPLPASAAATTAPAVTSPSPAKVYGEWKELWDKKTNRVYFRNTRTSESSWKMPEEVRALKGEEAEGNDAQGKKPRRIGPWVEKYDETRKRYYYVNTETKDRTWKVEETPFASSPP